MEKNPQVIRTVFDALAVIGLLLFAMWVMFVSLLVGPGYWGPTVGLLMHASAVGVAVYMLRQYGKTAQTLSQAVIVLLWIFGLFSVVFGFAPGQFIDPGVVFPKIIMFSYPILLFLSLQKKSLGRGVSKAAIVVHSGLSTGLFIVLFASAIQEPFVVNVLSAVVTGVFLILLFLVLYPFFRAVSIHRAKKKQHQF